VTTGVAFCGAVGHSQRHEYTGKDQLFLQCTSDMFSVCVCVLICFILKQHYTAPVNNGGRTQKAKYSGKED